MLKCGNQGTEMEVHKPKLVSRGHTPFRKRGKGSGNFRYSSLLPRTVECRTNHSTVFCHMTADAVTQVENCEVRKRWYKNKKEVKPSWQAEDKWNQGMTSWSREAVEAAVAAAAESLGYDSLKPEQQRVVTEFVLGRDNRVWKKPLLRLLTTSLWLFEGYGKQVYRCWHHTVDSPNERPGHVYHQGPFCCLCKCGDRYQNERYDLWRAVSVNLHWAWATSGKEKVASDA